MFPRVSLFWVLLYVLPSSSEVTGGSRNCSCGFYDGNTGNLFTDSIIVYFNETNGLPSEFIAEQYSNKYEKDWNAIYRQAADPVNIQSSNDSLQFIVKPPTDDHIVQGAGLRTARRDIPLLVLPCQ
jgi:hypothetical protein